jgi:hypothetical protein
MKLVEPFGIAPNLEPGVRIGKDWITITYSNQQGREGRTRYKYTILTDGQEYTGDDLQSGCGGGLLQYGMESLLAFLGAAGESYSDRSGGESENADLFPSWVNEWAHQNSDEISMMQCQIKETADLITE